MKKKLLALLLMLALCPLTALSHAEETNETEEEMMLRIEIGNAVLTAGFADTQAARELREKLADGPVTIAVSNYGGWEKVGDLPWRLPADDVQQTAQPGDIMLYVGRSIVLFYGQNSWAYTKLGAIIGADAAALRAALSGSETELTLSLTDTSASSAASVRRISPITP